MMGANPSKVGGQTSGGAYRQYHVPTQKDRMSQSGWTTASTAEANDSSPSYADSRYAQHQSFPSMLSNPALHMNGTQAHHATPYQQPSSSSSYAGYHGPPATSSTAQWFPPTTETFNTASQIDGRVVTSDSMHGVNVQSSEDFKHEVNALLYTQPLIIHTQVFPPGVTANDPRLATARVVSERTYIADKPVFPDTTFTATFHASLIPSHEPERRLVMLG